jgi:hypothetical protein
MVVISFFPNRSLIILALLAGAFPGHAADPATEKPKATALPVPASVTEIETGLAKLRKAVSTKPSVKTDVGEVTEFTVWFDASGAARKAAFVQGGNLRNEWYFAGTAAKEHPVFSIERGSSKEDGDYEMRSAFSDNGKLLAGSYQSASRVERFEPGNPTFEIEVDLRGAQTSVVMLLIEPLRKEPK